MKTIVIKSLTLFAIIITIPCILLNYGCKKDNNSVNKPHKNIDDAELITSLVLEFSDTANIKPNVTVAFRDLDGEGGYAPSEFDTISLLENTVYKVKISLMDESKIPNANITEEVEEEADEHLLCFDVTGANINVVRTDSDGAYEIGLQSRWTVTTASNGHVKVSLKHQPGIKNGTCDLGDSDVEVNFVTEVK